jgi:hypothetical protein
MSDDPLQYQLAVDHARAVVRGEHTATAVGNVAEYAGPMLALEVSAGVLLAVLAAFALRNRRGYLPDWARPLLGIKRTLHSRSELRPKPSPLQPTAWR